MNFLYILTISILFFTTFVTSQDPQILVLDDIVDVDLQPNVHKIFKVIINKQVGNETQLYISAQSPFNDPYQVPSMTITSDQQYKQYCFNAAEEFTDLCSIPTKQLTPNRSFTIELSCVVSCSLQLSAYLSQVLKLDLGESVTISAMSSFGVVVDIQNLIPQNTQFTQILVQTNILNIDEINQGLRLNVNYGNNETQFPTMDDYMIKGEATWKDGIAVTLSKQTVSAGQYIKIFLYVTKDMKVRFLTQVVNGTEYSLELNQQRYELIDYGEGRTYTVNLTSYMDQIKDQIVDVFVNIYSGDPDIMIAFDKSFPINQIITNDYISGTLNCMLTPQVRTKFNFTGMIYIKIESFWSASYKIYAWLNLKDFIPMKLQTTQINQIFRGDIQNYILQEDIFIAKNDTNKSTVLSYVLKIEMMQGSAMFGIRKCNSFQYNYSLACLIKDPKQFDLQENIQSFGEIQAQVIRSYTTYEVRYSYDFKKCHAYNESQGTTYSCVFQFVGTYDQSDINSTTFAITVYKRQISIQLKEGQIVKDTVEKQSYHFYVFQLPSLTNISEVSFFLTTIQGDCLLLGSSDFQYPTLIDVGTENITFSTNNLLTFENSTDKKFFISVYGYDASDYTLTTVVKRYSKDKNEKENENTLTSIKLKQNVIQQYTISQNHQSLLFSLNPNQQVPVKVMISNLQGVVSYKVQKLVSENNKTVIVPVTCEKKGDACQFNTTKDAYLQYQVLVTGNSSQTQIFTIGYSYPLLNRCSQQLMNTPIMMLVDKDTKQCLTFTLTKSKQIQILISVTTLQLIEGKIIANLKLGNKTFQIQQNNKKISVEQVEVACNGKQKFKACPLILQFNATMENAGFFVVVQETGNEMILFDGIPQKISTVSNNQKNAIYFYYQLYFLNKQVKIYFTTQETQKYTIVAKLMNQVDYLKSNISIFPTIDAPLDGFTFKRETTGDITIMKIRKKDIQSSDCTQCMLAISVFKTDGVDKDRIKFKIQATQYGSKLNIGQSKIGFVEEGQVYQYSVSTSTLAGGLFVVTSVHNDNCAGVFLDPNSMNDQASTFKSYVTLNQKGRKYKIYVKGYKQCSYQASFSSNDKPIHQTILSVPYTIILHNSSIQFLLYYHQTNDTFQLVENVMSGDSSIYVRPIKQDQELSTILQEKLSKFPFGDVNGSFSDVVVKNTDPLFCFKCYYLIGMQGLPNVREDIMVLLAGKLIPLKQNSILNDKITTDNIDGKKYVYHSINTFNLSIGILYGRVKVTVEQPGGNAVVNQQVSHSKYFSIRHPKQAEDNFMDLFDDTSKFTIVVTAIENSGYYLQITKHNVTLRLKEGLPTLLQINNQTQTQLQFINYNQGKIINVLVEVLTSELLTPNSLSFKVELQKQDNNNKQVPTSIVKSSVQSENSYNIQLLSYQSIYLISIKSSRIAKLNISIIVVRDRLTHLISSHDNLFSHQGIFQIYHGNQSVMIEVFNCIGEVQVYASNNYSFLQDNQDHLGQIVMERANYGGHYVISAQGQQGEYFLKTVNKNRNKKNQQLLYLISYYIYGNSQAMPYKKIITEHDKITPSVGDKSRIFSVKPINVKDSYLSTLNVKSIEYQLLISPQQAFIQQYSQCSMSSVHIQKYTVNHNFDSQQANPVFNIDTQTLKKIIGTSAKQFYVGAVASIELNPNPSSPTYPTYLKYIYDYTQVTLGVEILQNQKQSKTYFIWIVLPFLLASLFLMLACRYCIRRIYSTYYPTALVEEQGFGPSDDSFKGENNN